MHAAEQQRQQQLQQHNELSRAASSSSSSSKQASKQSIDFFSQKACRSPFSKMHCREGCELSQFWF
jgi:hypothetical protein